MNTRIPRKVAAARLFADRTDNHLAKAGTQNAGSFSLAIARATPLALLGAESRLPGSGPQPSNGVGLGGRRSALFQTRAAGTSTREPQRLIRLSVWTSPGFVESGCCCCSCC